MLPQGSAPLHRHGPRAAPGEPQPTPDQGTALRTPDRPALLPVQPLAGVAECSGCVLPGVWSAGERALKCTGCDPAPQAADCLSRLSQTLTRTWLSCVRVCHAGCACAPGWVQLGGAAAAQQGHTVTSCFLDQRCPGPAREGGAGSQELTRQVGHSLSLAWGGDALTSASLPCFARTSRQP